MNNPINDGGPAFLNAMHEAEKLLTPLQRFGYSALLTKIVGPKDQEYYLNLHATAAQRAEAFLPFTPKPKQHNMNNPINDIAAQEVKS